MAQPQPSISTILYGVSHYFEMPAWQISGQRRDAETLLARQIVIYLARQQTDCTLAEIGKELDNRSPATITHSYQKIARQLYHDGSSLKRVLRGIHNVSIVRKL